MKVADQLLFCFDLRFEKKLQAYIPRAFIVKKTNEISYLDKKISPEVLESFGLQLEQLCPNIQTLLRICDNLKLEQLHKKFSKNLKNTKTIEDLLKDDQLELGIQQFLKNNLSQFFSLVHQQNLPLSLNMGLDKDFRNSQILISPYPLQPHLHFDKHQNGICYTLALKDGEQLFYPSDVAIQILLNDPAWIVVNRKLFSLQNLNSKKLSPFISKKSIEIPTKLVPDYFEKFIKDVARKAEISATGFEIQTQNTILECSLIPVLDFFSNQYKINLLFDYGGYCFESISAKKSHSSIDISDLNHIKLFRYQRSLEEQSYSDKLAQLGLIKQENNLLHLPSNTEKQDALASISWAIENKELLESSGYSLKNLKIDNKTINTQKATVEASSSLKNDWFDLKMTVVFDSFAFDFSQLIPNIKERNRLFPLPNGEYFLIPLEWLSLYAPMLKLLKIQDSSLRLPKSNFAVLENIPGLDCFSNHSLSPVYQPSPLLKAELRPYQIEGVNWLLDHYHKGLGACLADDMGLGKTLQTLSTLVSVQQQLEDLKNTNPSLDLFGNTISSPKEYLKALIILPSSLVFNWNNEARKFSPHFRRLQYTGMERKKYAKKLENYDLIFTTYAIASRDLAILEKYHFRYLILDESHYIKNKNSKIFKSINHLKATHKISLSGTPIENSLDDLWSQLAFINPDLLGSHAFFTQNYKLPIEKKQDANALTELRNLIAPFILRRSKEQVLHELPELSEQLFYCEMEPEQQKLYEEEKSKARNSLLLPNSEKVNKINIINSLMRLRQLSNHPKMIDAASELASGKYLAVTQYLQKLIRSEQKTIVFSSFTSNLDLYKNWCNQNKIAFCSLSGETPPKEREYQLNRFQLQPKPLLFFISLKAGGVGLNITKASYVLFLDPWWNPFSEKQGIGRAHRMGQLNKVNVIRFITKDSVEEKIIRLQQNKKMMSDLLLDENFIVDELQNNLDFLLQ